MVFRKIRYRHLTSSLDNPCRASSGRSKCIFFSCPLLLSWDFCRYTIILTFQCTNLSLPLPRLPQGLKTWISTFLRGLLENSERPSFSSFSIRMTRVNAVVIMMNGKPRVATRADTATKSIWVDGELRPKSNPHYRCEPGPFTPVSMSLPVPLRTETARPPPQFSQTRVFGDCGGSSCDYDYDGYNDYVESSQPTSLFGDGYPGW
jgi:hypothetical protein